MELALLGWGWWSVCAGASRYRRCLRRRSLSPTRGLALGRDVDWCWQLAASRALFLVASLAPPACGGSGSVRNCDREVKPSHWSLGCLRLVVHTAHSKLSQALLVIVHIFQERERERASCSFGRSTFVDATYQYKLHAVVGEILQEGFRVCQINPLYCNPIPWQQILARFGAHLWRGDHAFVSWKWPSITQWPYLR